MSAGGIFFLVMMGYGAYLTWKRIFKKQVPTHEDDKGAIRIFMLPVLCVIWFVTSYSSLQFLLETGAIVRPTGAQRSAPEFLIPLFLVMVVSLWVSSKLTWKFEEWILNNRNKRER